MPAFTFGWTATLALGVVRLNHRAQLGPRHDSLLEAQQLVAVCVDVQRLVRSADHVHVGECVLKVGVARDLVDGRQAGALASYVYLVSEPSRTKLVRRLRTS